MLHHVEGNNLSQFQRIVVPSLSGLSSPKNSGSWTDWPWRWRY